MSLLVLMCDSQMVQFAKATLISSLPMVLNLPRREMQHKPVSVCLVGAIRSLSMVKPINRATAALGVHSGNVRIKNPGEHS